MYYSGRVGINRLQSSMGFLLFFTKFCKSGPHLTKSGTNKPLTDIRRRYVGMDLTMVLGPKQGPYAGSLHHSQSRRSTQLVVS